MLNDNWGDGNRSDMVGLARPRGLIYMVLSRGKAHVADAFALRLSITLTFIRAVVDSQEGSTANDPSFTFLCTFIPFARANARMPWWCNGPGLKSLAGGERRYDSIHDESPPLPMQESDWPITITKSGQCSKSGNLDPVLWTA